MSRTRINAAIEAGLFEIFRAQDVDPRFVHLRRPSGVATRFVPGDGALSPRVIFVGEAPGRQEDLHGSPFVGPAGQFLDELLPVANLFGGRREVWITNVLKFRPPRNREPTEEEISAARPYLRRELALLGRTGCRTVVGLGRTACEAIAGASISPVSRAGSWIELRNDWRLFVSPHPSWGIRSERNKARMREVFSTLAYDLARPTEENGEEPGFGYWEAGDYS